MNATRQHQPRCRQCFCEPVKRRLLTSFTVPRPRSAPLADIFELQVPGTSSERLLYDLQVHPGPSATVDGIIVCELCDELGPRTPGPHSTRNLQHQDLTVPGICNTRTSEYQESATPGPHSTRNLQHQDLRAPGPQSARNLQHQDLRAPGI
uniref:Uncharacterized protein n=1 Tax=Knipowitschia caucasica TaxID=637954 RepID=A0AAV2LUZ6_KNICA